MTIEYKDSKRIIALSSDWTADVTSNITWSTTGKVGYNISGTTISRTGSAGWSLSKIQSEDTFTVGNGKFMIEFSGNANDENSTQLGFNTGTLGYNHGSATPQNKADFAIYMAGGSQVEVYESGTKNYDSGGSRSASDRYRIEIDNDGLVKYYLQAGGTGSWVLKHTSSTTASGTYFIQANSYADTSVATVHSKTVNTAVAKPSDVQDNSLLVEKDTARRYWRTPNTVTLQSDFSSNTGWTTSSSSLLNVDTSAQEIDFTFNVDNGDLATMYYDLTSTSDTKWLLRSQIDIDTIAQGSDTNDKWLFYGLSSTNNGANETQDFLGMAIRVDNTKTELLAIETDGSAPNNESTTVFTRNAQAETLYVEMKRESATSFTVSLYSDSAYSTLLESKTITVSSGTATLRYLKLSGLQGFSDSQIVGSIPNMTLYNSATTPATWFPLDRGVFGGGETSAAVNTMDYITITTLGNATDFGDLTASRYGLAGVSSSTRGIFGGGRLSNNSNSNTMDYITIVTTGNASDFGDLSVSRRVLAGLSSETRGVFGGGYSTTDVMDYITIATLGNATDFGNLTVSRYGLVGVSSDTRGVFGGGYDGSYLNTMDYITIATTGNATDFGDMTVARYVPAGVSSETRGVFCGGQISGSTTNVMDYITIATPSNATDFGDLSVTRDFSAGASSSTRGVIGGGWTGSSSNVMDYITIATPSNATDFGDLSEAKRYLAGVDDS